MEHNKDNTRRRPSEVSEDHIQSEWDRIFDKKARDDYDHMFYKDKVEEKVDTTRTTGIHEGKTIVT